MKYDKTLADEVRKSIHRHRWQDAIVEKEDERGLVFYLETEPLAEVKGDELLVRCFPEDTDTYLLHYGVLRYEKNDRIDIMGLLRILPEVWQHRDELDKWLQISYNYVSTEVSRL